MNHPEVENIIQANKYLKMLKIMDYGLKFSHLGAMSKEKQVAFSDAFHASLPDGYSTAEVFITFLVGENGKCCLLAWEDKKIKVVKSTLVAETLAAADAKVCCLKFY